MASEIRIPVDLRSPEQTGLAGNSFWTVSSGVASQQGYWAFLGNTSGGSGTGIDVTGGIVYGLVQMPKNLEPDSTGIFVLAMGASATAGGLSAWRVSYSEIQTGVKFDLTANAWNAINAKNWTAPTTGYARHDMTFDTTGTFTAESIVMVRLERDTDGTSATDNITATVGVFDAYVQITATA